MEKGLGTIVVTITADFISSESTTQLKHQMQSIFFLKTKEYETIIGQYTFRWHCKMQAKPISMGRQPAHPNPQGGFKHMGC